MTVNLFAMVDDYIGDELRVKVLSLCEMPGNGGYRHTILPHLSDHARTLKIQRITANRDTNLQRINLDTSSLYLWRTLFTVQYANMLIPILDTNLRESMPGEYDYRVPLNMAYCLEYFDARDGIRETMLTIIRGRPDSAKSVEVKKFPKFVTDALKRDAIHMNYTCPISMDMLADIPAAITSCYHIFSHDSIIQSMHNNNKCPVCREKISFVQLM